MRGLFTGLFGAVLVSRVLGHNIHGILLVNGTESPEWKYVLDIEGPFLIDEAQFSRGYQGHKLNPIIGVSDPNVTCGRAAFNSALRTETADVIAGSEVGFRVSADGRGNRGQVTPNPEFWHPGPAQIYLSRAPNDDLRHYKGDGEWFKIAYAGPTNNTHWSLWPSVSDFNFTIPKTTPPGKYLMRIENFMPTDHEDFKQFYVNCAFINVIGPGGGTPTKFARFPGSYELDDTGLVVPLNQDLMSGKLPIDEIRLLEYKPPGPAMWTG